MERQDQDRTSEGQQAAGQPAAAWDRAKLDHFEQRLLAERKDAVEQMARFDETFREGLDEQTTGWRFHMADEGTDTMEQEQTYLMASREGQLLWHIDQGLRRLYKSPATFGRCDECGTTIAFERLDAIPYA